MDFVEDSKQTRVDCSIFQDIVLGRDATERLYAKRSDQNVLEICEWWF